MKRGLVWLRRDLRIHDHAALCAALQSCEQVFLAFIFDQTILDLLKDDQRTHPQDSEQSSSTSKMITDRRVDFIWHALQEINHELKELSQKSGLITLHGISTELIPNLAVDLQIQSVFVNQDYEPLAIARDAQVQEALLRKGVEFLSYKD